MSKIFINTDGGARGNPGPAAIGVHFADSNGKKLYEHREKIGEATNNQAEYQAIIKALEILLKSKWLSQSGEKAEVICRLDSQLVVEQINGNYKIKNQDIKVYTDKVKDLLLKINKNVIFYHIPREQNKVADKLVNMALDDK